MKKCYGTDLCINCVEAKKYIKENNIEIDFIDITESIENLKEFLSLRDNNEIFDEVKKQGRVGIPCFVDESGNISFTL